MRRWPFLSATAMSVARPLMFVGPRYDHVAVPYGDDVAHLLIGRIGEPEVLGVGLLRGLGAQAQAAPAATRAIVTKRESRIVTSLQKKKGGSTCDPPPSVGRSEDRPLHD